jgi:hypothetical protein
MPNFDKIFASQALSGELVEMLEAQYRRGWGYLNPGEAPPMEFFNYFFNNIDAKARLLAKIIGVWQPNEAVYKGYVRKPTNNPAADIFVICQSEQGITGALEPNWTAAGTTAQDGGVTWEINVVSADLWALDENGDIMPANIGGN